MAPLTLQPPPLRRRRRRRRSSKTGAREFSSLLSFPLITLLVTSRRPNPRLRSPATSGARLRQPGDDSASDATQLAGREAALDRANLGGAELGVEDESGFRGHVVFFGFGDEAIGRVSQIFRLDVDLVVILRS